MIQHWLLSLAVAPTVTLGCAGYQTADVVPESGAVPVIVRLSPSSGPAGVAIPVQITIEGHGFAPTTNVVTFGGIASSDLPSHEDGTRISFWIPKEAPSSGEVPPMVLLPAEYQLTVTTPGGISDPVVFVLTPPEREGDIAGGP